eukprot:TRINITY_DN1901_c0_g1_i1.p1 TRINITY_DN1901_c0_g1~~TRINITY_DN1901_c0_g1_i1.p1  ORF type:complete len:364 (+),score=28.21 TRINITY_DN1901_c0_g1_i1:67-1158(+)
MSVDISIQIVQDKVYFELLNSRPEFVNSQSEWLQSSDIYDILYIPFAYDFGPPSIAQVYKFVKIMNRLVEKSKKIIKWYSLFSLPINTTNALYLMGGYCIFSLGWTAQQTTETFMQISDFLVFYRDASQGPANYDLDVFACFRAMEKAKALGWIDFNTFDYQEYTFYEQVENGDFNWLVPNKFLAMATPTAVARRTPTTVTHTPEYYIPYFKKNNVTCVIRLNTVEYDRNSFLKEGIDHHDMYFVDGTVPSLAIIDKFIHVCETTPGAIAVHCKQGLGRTGTLIACYLMKHYDFSVPEMIAFLRIQRPGSVVGPQQHFLHSVEAIVKGPKINVPVRRIKKCSLEAPAVISLKKPSSRATPTKV